MNIQARNSLWKHIQFIGPRYILTVLLVAVGLRMMLFLIFHPWTPRIEIDYILTGDALGYHELATTLIESHRFAHSQTGESEALRTPLYPVFIALIYFLVGYKPWVIIIIQIVLDILSCFLLLLALSQLFCRRIALVASTFYALDPLLILYSSTKLLSDIFFIFLLVVAFWFLSIAIVMKPQGKMLLNYGLSSLFLGMATLIRPISQYILICYFIFFLVAYWKRPRIAITSSVIVFVVFGLVLSFWIFRNYSAFGSFSLSTSGSYNLLVLNVVPMEMAERHEDANTIKDFLLAEADKMIEADGLHPQDLNEFQRARYWQELAIRYIANAPFAFAKSYFLGVVHTFFSFDTRSYAEVLGLAAVDFDIKAYTNIADLAKAFVKTKGVVGLMIGGIITPYLLASYFGAIIGILISWKRFYRPSLFLILALVLYFVLITGVAGIARFRLPLIPFYLTFTAIGLSYLYEKITLWISPDIYRSTLVRDRYVEALSQELPSVTSDGKVC